MVSKTSSRVTDLLRQWRNGDQEALDQLMPLVYDELQQLARRYMRRELPNHTLQPTALVHEAFTRLVDQDIPWRDRAHLVGVFANEMRRVLVDHARARQAVKRGGRAFKVTLDETVAGFEGATVDLLPLHNALNTLAKFDPQKARIVELRFFGGLNTLEDIAEVVGRSKSAVERDLKFALAWLKSEIA